MQSPISEPVVVIKSSKRKAPKKGKVSVPASLQEFAKERHLEIISQHDRIMPSVCLQDPESVEKTLTLLAKVADELGIESVLGINPKVSNVVEIQVASLSEPDVVEPVDANVNEKCLVSRAGSAIVDTKVTCLCGAIITQKSLGKHLKTSKHLKVVPVVFDGI